MGVVKSRGVDQFNLRLPAGLRERVRLSAEANNRSMNSELIALIEKSLPPVGVGMPAGVLQSMKNGMPPLQAIRKWRGMSHRDLAEATGMEVWQVKTLEEQRRFSSLAMAKVFAEALNVTVDDLI